eukprot:GHRQ01019207.1.p1 GENE.GHRQ01019207.1~~GHRQ01019207.1.p1  ORF type:complete len:185 (+),score=11.07 GHRQ01019207.1:953-1507(+)
MYPDEAAVALLCLTAFLSRLPRYEQLLFLHKLKNKPNTTLKKLRVLKKELTGVMATGKVVGSVLLAGDQLLWVEQLPVGAGANLIDHGGLEVEEDAAGHVLARASLAEEGVEGIIATTDGLVAGHLRKPCKRVVKASAKQARRSVSQVLLCCSPGHQAECRAPGNKTPSRHFRPGYRPGRYGWR